MIFYVFGVTLHCIHFVIMNERSCTAEGRSRGSKTRQYFIKASASGIIDEDNTGNCLEAI